MYSFRSLSRKQDEMLKIASTQFDIGCHVGSVYRLMNMRTLSLLAAISLTLHVLVPPGFMPTNLGDGWYLKWCPDGMSAEIMHALFGHEHHAEDHQNQSYAQCDLSGLSADADPPATLASTDSVFFSLPTPPRRGLPKTRSAHSGYHSRAPPVTSLI